MFETFEYQPEKQSLTVQIFDASVPENEMPFGIVKVGQDLNANSLFVHIDKPNGAVSQIRDGDGVERIDMGAMPSRYVIHSKARLDKIRKQPKEPANKAPKGGDA